MSRYVRFQVNRILIFLLIDATASHVSQCFKQTVQRSCVLTGSKMLLFKLMRWTDSLYTLLKGKMDAISIVYPDFKDGKSQQCVTLRNTNDDNTVHSVIARSLASY